MHKECDLCSYRRSSKKDLDSHKKNKHYENIKRKTTRKVITNVIFVGSCLAMKLLINLT